jgi:hypothetical protein
LDDPGKLFLNMHSAAADLSLPVDLLPCQEPFPAPSPDEDKSSFAAFLRATVRPRIEEGHLWEQLAAHSGCIGPSASMVACGGLSTATLVPGAAQVGRLGLWFPNNSSSRSALTQVAARFFRDSRVSTSDSVLVNLALCMDSALTFPTMLAWEEFSTQPLPCPGEEVAPIIPTLCNKGVDGLLTLLRAPLDSPLSTRLSPTIVIFSTLPKEGVDYASLEAVLAFSSPAGGGGGGRTRRRALLEATGEARRAKGKQLDGLKRHVPVRNAHGFQEQVAVRLLGVDPVLATVVFGITRLGAQPNSLNVNSRNIWHATLAITENINRYLDLT